MKIGFVGLESSGKSLAIAQVLQNLVYRNAKWEKKYGFHRLIFCNLRLSKSFLQEHGRYIRYFSEVKELLPETGIDVIFDEISSHFSAEKQTALPLKVNTWLRQGAKQGVHIYFTAQELHDVHNHFRRRVKECYEMSKFIGSDRGGKNMPPVDKIWGVVFKRRLQINPYNELQKVYLDFAGIPKPLFITRKLCSIFDTYFKIEQGEEAPLEHSERVCPDCKQVEIYHSGRKSKTIFPFSKDWYTYWNNKK